MYTKPRLLWVNVDVYVAKKNYFRNFNFNFNYRKLNSKWQNPLFLVQHDIGFEIKDQGTGAVRP